MTGSTNISMNDSIRYELMRWLEPTVDVQATRDAIIEAFPHYEAHGYGQAVNGVASENPPSNISMTAMVEQKNNYLTNSEGLESDSDISLANVFDTYDSKEAWFMIKPHVGLWECYNNHGTLWNTTSRALRWAFRRTSTGIGDFHNNITGQDSFRFDADGAERSILGGKATGVSMHTMTNGNQVMDFSGTDSLEMGGGLGGFWATGTHSTLLNIDSKGNPLGDTQTLCMWINFDSLPSTGSVSFFHTNCKAVGNTTAPYAGWNFTINYQGRVGVTRGDGGGRQSSNRKTFLAASTLSTGTWYFMCFHLHQTSNIGADNQIHIFTENSTVSTSLNAVTGTGNSTQVASPNYYLFPTANQYVTAINAQMNGRQLDAKVGHVMAFKDELSVLDMVNMRNNMKSYYAIPTGTGGGGGGLPAGI